MSAASKPEKPQQPEGTFPVLVVHGRGGIVAVGLTQEECTLRLRGVLGGGRTVTLREMLSQHGLKLAQAWGRPLWDLSRAERTAASKDATAPFCVVADYRERDASKVFGVSITTANLANSALASGGAKKGESFPPRGSMFYPFAVIFNGT